MKPIALAQFAAWLGAEISDGLVTGLAVDSRQVEAGDLYFAFRGEHHDGHDFLEEVAARGAAAAVVDTPCEAPLPLLVVDDVLGALQLAAERRLAEIGARVVAITGSVGKTTTKDFLQTLLARKFRVGASHGNQNSQIGMPLSILALEGDEEVVVLEMAMTAPGHILRLCEIAPPDVALVTEIALVHAASAGDLEGIGRCKSEIYHHAKKGIVPRTSTFEILHTAGSCPKVTFGSPGSDFWGVKEGRDFILYEKGEAKLTTPWTLPGVHNIHNFIAAAAAARQLGMGWNQIASAIPDLTLPDQRFEIVRTGQITVVNDTYNACRKSVCAALDSLPEPEGEGRRIAVLAGIVDLGEHEDSTYRNIATHALGRVDHLVCLGEALAPMWETWSNQNRDVKWCPTRAELLDHLREILSPGDVVLVKGSRLYAMEEIVDALLCQ